jgi:hypothetical protein
VGKHKADGLAAFGLFCGIFLVVGLPSVVMFPNQLNDPYVTGGLVFCSFWVVVGVIDVIWAKLS